MRLAPRVSIVIPTRNGAETLPALLDVISRQKTAMPFEIVAVDSSSTDGTPGILRGRVDGFVSIPADTFDHGLTRNLGISRSRGELIVLLVQDALPASEGWLEALTAPFSTDARLAGAFARQLPRPTASLLARHYLSRWQASSETTRTFELAGQAEFDALGPQARLDRCAFDSVCGCIRRSVWTEHPFRSTPIGEDVEWAKEVLLAGYRLAYVPGAAVIHSHERTARYEFRRTYLLHRRLVDLFGLRTIPSLPALTRAILSSLLLHLRLVRGSGLIRAIALAFAWPLGQYLGGRAKAGT